MVVSAHNLAQAERVFREQGLTNVTGRRYLGGYNRDDAPQANWLGKKVKDWVGGIRKMAGVVYKNPQTSYTGLQKSLQQ